MNGTKGRTSIREATCHWARRPILRAWAIPENAEQGDAKQSGGKRHAKAKMEFERHLHI